MYDSDDDEVRLAVDSNIINTCGGLFGTAL